MSSQAPQPSSTSCREQEIKYTRERSGCAACTTQGRVCTCPGPRESLEMVQYQALHTPITEGKSIFAFSTLGAVNRFIPSCAQESSHPERCAAALAQSSSDVWYDIFAPVFFGGPCQSLFSESPWLYRPGTEMKNERVPWTNEETYRRYLYDEAIASVFRGQAHASHPVPSIWTVQAWNDRADGYVSVYVAINGPSGERPLWKVVTTTPSATVEARIATELKPRQCYMTLGVELPEPRWFDYWLLFQIGGVNRVCTSLHKQPEPVFDDKPNTWTDEPGYCRYVQYHARQTINAHIGIHEIDVLNFDCTPTTMLIEVFPASRLPTTSRRLKISLEQEKETCCSNYLAQLDWSIKSLVSLQGVPEVSLEGGIQPVLKYASTSTSAKEGALLNRDHISKNM